MIIAGLVCGDKEFAELAELIERKKRDCPDWTLAQLLASAATTLERSIEDQNENSSKSIGEQNNWRRLACGCWVKKGCCWVKKG